MSRLFPFFLAAGIFILSFQVSSATVKNVPPKITVFAASSLKESMDTIMAEWTKKSGQKVVVSYAASSALAKQIEQGAPADIFISADGEWMDYLQQRNKIATNTRFNLVGNRLVLIVPATSKQALMSLNKPEAILRALGDGRLAVAETGSVPAGRYARQSLIKMKVWDSVSARLAQGENVRAAMAFVARNESPLGIVYATDAIAEPRVRVIATFADDSHDAIVYPAAAVAGASPDSTKAFLKFMQGNQVKTIFKQAGFTLP